LAGLLEVVDRPRKSNARIADKRRDSYDY